jgi:hypothetical protein
MTKRNYSGQARADLDDTIYWDALEQGIVGESCTIGGPVIDELRSFSPSDICAACSVSADHRVKVCYGRPMKKIAKPEHIAVDAIPSVVHAVHQTAEAYRMRQDQQIRAILQQLGPTTKEKL